MLMHSLTFHVERQFQCRRLPDLAHHHCQCHEKYTAPQAASVMGVDGLEGCRGQVEALECRLTRSRHRSRPRHRHAPAPVRRRYFCGGRLYEQRYARGR